MAIEDLFKDGDEQFKDKLGDEPSEDDKHSNLDGILDYINGNITKQEYPDSLDDHWDAIRYSAERIREEQRKQALAKERERLQRQVLDVMFDNEFSVICNEVRNEDAMAIIIRGNLKVSRQLYNTFEEKAHFIKALTEAFTAQLVKELL